MPVHRILSTPCRVATLLLVALLLICLPQPRARALGSLIFQDNFSGHLNRTVWNPFITDNPANGVPWNFQSGQEILSSAEARPNGFGADYDLPSLIDSGIRHVGLDLKDKMGSTANGYTWSGSAICTYPDTRYHKTTGFTFNNAYVEVRAKMPADLQCGGWPAIWFLAAPGSSSPEIDLQEGGFTDGSVPPQDIMHSTLWYPNGKNDEIPIDTGEDLSADYHTYALAYKAGSYVKMYLDGKVVASWTTNVPTGSYYLIINNSLAASTAKGWHTEIDSSTPSSGDMFVQYVRAYRLQ